MKSCFIKKIKHLVIFPIYFDKKINVGGEKITVGGESLGKKKIEGRGNTDIAKYNEQEEKQKQEKNCIFTTQRNITSDFFGLPLPRDFFCKNIQDYIIQSCSRYGMKKQEAK